MIVLKLLPLIIILATGVIRVALQEKWRNCHDRRTKVHKWVLRFLIVLMVLETIAAICIIFWDDARSTRLASDVNTLHTDNQQLKEQVKLKTDQIIALSARQAEKSALSGRLQSQEALFSKELMRVYFGSNCYSYPVETLGNEKVIHPFSGIDVSLKDGQLMVSAEVFGTNNNFSTELLENNEWNISPNNYRDRNYDQSALEVRDGATGFIVLQVELLDQRSLRLSGLFRDGSYLWCFGDSPEILRIKRDEIEKYLPQVESCLETQQRLFAYPSNEHLHERATNTKGSRFKDALLRQQQELGKRRGEYAGLSKEDLRQRVLAFTKELTKLCQGGPELPDSFPQASDPNSYMDQLTKELEPLIRHGQSVVAKFDQDFRIEAIVLRDELLSRQRQQTRTYRVYSLYEIGVNSVTILLIAEDLQRLANSL